MPEEFDGPPTVEQALETACQLFRMRWQEGERPRIEDYLHGVSDSVRPQVLRELTRIDLHFRSKAGEIPHDAEYLDRFPQDREVLERVFADFAKSDTVEGSLPRANSTLQGTGATTQIQANLKLGGYEILGEIARGGMGVVYRARQTNLNRLVALKVILSGSLADEEQIQRFRGEAEAAAKFDHPHIVPVFEVGEDNGRQFFSMGLVDGENLEQSLKKQDYSPRQSAQLVRSLAEAVHYAHDRGVLHRDLKPGNVLIDATGIPKITDFGLARQIDADTNLTQTGQIMGTPSYMPPEQAQGRIKDVGPASDVYALGGILYRMLAGRAPFQGNSTFEILRQVNEDDPVSLRSINSKVPADLETICLQCLKKTPAERYASARELADELDRWLNGRAILARRSSRLEKAWKWCKRHPAWTAAGVMSCVAWAALLAVWILMGGQEELEEGVIKAEQNAGVAEERAEQAEQQAIEDKRRRLAAEKLRSLADRKAAVQLIRQADSTLQAEEFDAAACRQLLDGVPEDLRSWDWRYLDAIFRSRIQTIAREGNFGAVAFSPDDALIAAARDKSVCLYDLQSGELLHTWRTLKEQPRSLRFSGDGRKLFSANARGLGRDEFFVWDVASGDELFAYSQIGSSWNYATDANFNFLMLNHRKNRAALINLETGARRVLLESDAVTKIAVSPDGTRAVTITNRQLFGHLWNLEGRGSILKITSSVMDLAFSADGKKLLLVGYKTAKVLDSRTGDTLFSLPASENPFRRGAFDPTGGWIVTGDERRNVKVWEADTGEEIFSGLTLPGEISELKIAPNGETIYFRLTNDGDGVADAKKRKVLARYGTRPRGRIAAPFRLMKLDPTLKTGILQDILNRRTIQLQKFRSGDIGDRLIAPGRVGIQLSNSGKRVALAGQGLWIWKPLSPPQRKTIEPLSGRNFFQDLTFHTDGRTLIGRDLKSQLIGLNSQTGDPIPSNRIKEIARDRPEAQPIPHDGQLKQGSSVVLTRNGELAAGCFANGEVRVWNTADGKVVRTIPADVSNVAIDPHGFRVFGVSLHSTRAWSVETGEPLFETSLGASAVSVTRDGNRLILLSTDESIRILDALTGLESLRLTTDEPGKIMAFAVSPTGERIAVGNLEGQVTIWSAVPSDSLNVPIVGSLRR